MIGELALVSLCYFGCFFFLLLLLRSFTAEDKVSYLGLMSAASNARLLNSKELGRLGWRNVSRPRVLRAKDCQRFGDLRVPKICWSLFLGSDRLEFFIIWCLNLPQPWLLDLKALLVLKGFATKPLKNKPFT